MAPQPPSIDIDALAEYTALMAAHGLISPQQVSQLLHPAGRGLPVREPATFEFAGKPYWNGVPIINGHRILSAQSIDVHVDGGVEWPVVTLKLIPADALKLLLGDARVEVADQTREALISLGWTPPEIAAFDVWAEPTETGGRATKAQCLTCVADIAVETGLTGTMTLDDQIAEVRAQAATQPHRQHQTIRLGSFHADDADSAPRPCGTECDC